MTFKQTRDIIEYVAFFHKQLSDFYYQLSETTDKVRVRMLLDYLGRREKEIENKLNNYEHKVASGILNTWFKSIPDILSPEFLIEIKILPHMSVDNVMNIVLHFDDYLVQLFKEIAQKAEVQSVKDVLTDLSGMEKKEELNFVRDSLWFKDI